MVGNCKFFFVAVLFFISACDSGAQDSSDAGSVENTELAGAAPTDDTPVWDVTQVYPPGSIVQYDGQTYVSTGVVSGDDPLEQPVMWKIVDASTESIDLNSSEGSQTSIPTAVASTEVNNVVSLSEVSATQLAAALPVVSSQGPPGVDGLPGLVWKGPWQAGEIYDIGDAVNFSQQSYIATARTDGVASPAETAYWDLLAGRGAAGADGTQGLPGIQGTPGIQGNIGDTGAAGPAGPQGLRGDTGPAGPQGDIGAAGPAGPQGDAGATGPAGPQGDAGTTGPAGPQGDAGATGPAGPQGDAGATGPAGPQGDAGATGPAGPQGDAGATGPAGPQGDAGATGPAGPQGDTGLTWEGSWSAIGGYSLGDAVSYDGSAYIAIQTVPTGTQPTNNAYWDVLAAAGEDGTSGGSSSGSGALRYVMAGITTSQFAGNAGYRVMNAACETDFGASARLATSLDIARFPLNTSVAGMGWIQGISHPSNMAIDNTTGFDLSGAANNLTCNSWTTNSGGALVMQGYNLSLNQYASCSNTIGAICSVVDGVEQPYKFAGFSTTSTNLNGGSGYLNMANACRDDFGSSARMATTEEVTQSNLGTSQTGVAWVHGLAHASDPGIDRITGVTTGAGNSLTCKGWSESGSVYGLTVTGADYSIGTQYCYQQAAVACSVPE